MPLVEHLMVRDFDGSFTRTITTERLAEQPQSINIVLGESYGLWPFLGEYNEPGAYLVEQGRKYAASPQAMSTQLALAQGTGTMPAINGFTHWYARYRPISQL